jgi:hypothetical protein
LFAKKPKKVADADAAFVAPIVTTTAGDRDRSGQVGTPPQGIAGPSKRSKRRGPKGIVDAEAKAFRIEMVEGWPRAKANGWKLDDYCADNGIDRRSFKAFWEWYKTRPDAKAIDS